MASGPWLMRCAADGEVLATQVSRRKERAYAPMVAAFGPAGGGCTSPNQTLTQGLDRRAPARDSLQRRVLTRGIEPLVRCSTPKGNWWSPTAASCAPRATISRDPRHMDSSLVRLDPRSSGRLGQWWLRQAPEPAPPRPRLRAPGGRPCAGGYRAHLGPSDDLPNAPPPPSSRCGWRQPGNPSRGTVDAGFTAATSPPAWTAFYLSRMTVG